MKMITIIIMYKRTKQNEWADQFIIPIEDKNKELLDFFRNSIIVNTNMALANWHSNGYPARRLALQRQRRDWLARCQYTVTRWDRKFDLQLLSQSGSKWICLRH